MCFSGLEAGSPRAGVGRFDFSEASSLGWQMAAFLLCHTAFPPDRYLLSIYYFRLDIAGQPRLASEFQLDVALAGFWCLYVYESHPLKIVLTIWGCNLKPLECQASAARLSPTPSPPALRDCGQKEDSHSNLITAFKGLVFRYLLLLRCRGYGFQHVNFFGSVRGCNSAHNSLATNENCYFFNFRVNNFFLFYTLAVLSMYVMYFGQFHTA